jgi:tetratricopeptide (TPR) repeat protein
MSWWKNLISGGSDQPPRDTDYYQEGTDLLRQEKYHEALTSFQLALRENPNDTDVLLQIAMTYSLIGMTDEAVRRYRRVLELKPHSAGAHYGLAFLLLPRGSIDEGIAHLRAFLANPPSEATASRHVAHAREVLTELTGEVEHLPGTVADE